ncbi:uncharacterized protein LOC132394795 [Hypanus sabinus]|uniref:uncharacterized protein LOC132394795 n=1 Tax=Hypanus sabinus TaxID=79690 RepID=UPI0028C3B3BD|nr:uncharacterized protein LOC132394795 [Hypanus sabinus]
MEAALRAALIVLVFQREEVSAASHFLRFFLTSTTEIPDFPQLLFAGYVDGVQFMTYNSDRPLVPQDQWMSKSEGAKWWRRKLEFAKGREIALKQFSSFIMSQSNHSRGAHTLQQIFGCDLEEDGTSSGFSHYSWDSMDVMRFDQGHMFWVTSSPWAQNIKNQCSADLVRIKRLKDFLEKECVQWLQRYVEYGERESRVVAPQVTFTPLDHSQHLSCLATGFHPPSIEVTLWRNGTILHEAYSSGLLLNHDGTHQIRKWVQVDPADPGPFSCRVEHGGLEDALTLIYVLSPDREAQPWIPLMVGLLVTILVLTIIIGAVYRWREGVKRTYVATQTTEDAGSSASSLGNMISLAVSEDERLTGERTERTSQLIASSQGCLILDWVSMDLWWSHQLPHASVTFWVPDTERTGSRRMMVLMVLTLLCDAVSAESHSLRICLTSTTKIPNFPQLVAVTSVDGVQFVVYDSHRRLVPQEPWMVKSEGATWLKKKSLAAEWERAQKKLILFIMSTTDQLSEIHTLQQEIGCDLRADGTTRGFTRYSWDGEDLLSLDEDQMEWDTFAMWAERIKHHWDQDKVNIQKWKYFLKEDCVQWLRKFLAYGKRQLRVDSPISLPPVPPQVTFTISADTSLLSCLATGFRPSSIVVTLWRNRTILPEAHSSGLLPNHDSTHQIRKWVQIDPADPALFSCRVEHSGLKDPIIWNYVRGTQPWIQPDLLSSSSIFREWHWISLGIVAISIIIIIVVGC